MRASASSRRAGPKRRWNPSATCWRRTRPPCATANAVSIPAAELVPGDVVLLEAGDKVAADLRLIRGLRGLQVEEAILTGESVPVDKATASRERRRGLGDRSSMAYSGTIVTSGQGRGVVSATGAETEIGRISGLLADVEKC
jgi:P-type E1-E2 ATPase